MQTYSTPTGNGPSSTADQAKDKAQEAAGQAKGALRSQVDQRSTDAGQRVGGLASDVRSVGSSCASRARISPRRWPSRPRIALSVSAAT